MKLLLENWKQFLNEVKEMENVDTMDLLKGRMAGVDAEKLAVSQNKDKEPNLVSATPVLNQLSQQIEELKTNQERLQHILEKVVGKLDDTSSASHNAGSILSPGVSPLDRSKRRGSVLSL